MSSNNHGQAYHHAHHFESAEHEYATSKEGVWLFLTSEILMFGGLFVGYIIYQGLYPEVFAEGAKHLDWRLGALNTIVLLTSSLTMVLGVHYSQAGDKHKAVTNLALTIACGAIFMIVVPSTLTKFMRIAPGTWYSGVRMGSRHGLIIPST